MGLLGASWGPWGLLGASRGLLGSLGASWGPLGASWGPLLEPSWGPLRPSWKPLGLSWGPSWAVLGPSWAPLGPSWDNAYWGPLGRSWSDGKLNSRELQKPSKTNGKIMSVASWGPLRRPLGGLLGRLGGLLGRLRAILGVVERSFVGSGHANRNPLPHPAETMQGTLTATPCLLGHWGRSPASSAGSPAIFAVVGRLLVLRASRCP